MLSNAIKSVVNLIAFWSFQYHEAMNKLQKSIDDNHEPLLFEWATVELLGHRRIEGEICQIGQGSTTLYRVTNCDGTTIVSPRSVYAITGRRRPEAPKPTPAAPPFAVLSVLALVACSAPPQEPEPWPVDAGADAPDAAPACVTYEPWQHTGHGCDPALGGDGCPPSNNPCMQSFCTNDGVCVLVVPGEGQPGVCGAGQWCRFVGAEVLGCCTEPPACIYDATFQCSAASPCPYATNPTCNGDGECCQ